MFLLLLVAQIAAQPAGTRDEQIEFLRLSFKANKETFQFGTVQFEYTKGRCANLFDAESEVFSSPSIREDGLYVFDRKSERYDLLAEPAALAEVTTRISATRSSSIAHVFRELTDGEVTLRDELWLDDAGRFSHRSPEIYPGTAIFHSSAYFKFPLALCNCGRIDADLFDDLTAIKEGRGTIAELDFDSRLDGLPVCKLSYTYHGGRGTYWIDLSRGCLPLRIQIQHDRGSDTIYKFGDFEHVAGAGWIPRRRLHTFLNGKVTDRVVITKIDTTNRPPHSMFQLSFPEPVPLHDQARGLVHRKRDKWSLLDLPGASSPDTRAVPAQRMSPGQNPIVPGASSPLNAGEMPGETEPASDWLTLTSGTIVSAIAASLMLLWRLRRKRQGA